MDPYRHRLVLVALVALALLPTACATQESGFVKAYSYPRQPADPFWWRALVDVQGARDKGWTGNGKTVAIVDSGVLKTHEDLTASNIIDGLEFCSSTGPTTKTTDENGHGTQLAGIVLGNDPVKPADIRTTRGVAPNANLVPFKVVCAVTMAAAVVRGVQSAIGTTPPPDVILLALGPWPGDTDANGNDVHTLIAPFISLNANILFVVASVWDPTYIPRPVWTTYDNVVVVAGMTLDDSNNEIPYSDKRGDIWAPAQGVGTASITQDPKDASKHVQFLMPGTSAASAIVAGCAALIKEKNSGYNGKALKDSLVRAVEKPAGLPGAGRLKCSGAF